VTPPTVTVPVRVVVAVLAATLNVTEPFPDPLAPAVTVIHEALLVAVQLQPLPAVTVIVPEPPVAATDCDVGLIAYVQDAAACVTVKVVPATVSVPARDVVAVFAATLNVTEPLPDPLEPAVTVIQLALLVAVHPHPVPAVTEIVPEPPEEANDCEVGLIA
jgi:uncharacterized protein YhhL (DUF1145 family)